jgi:hypothetical protein
LSWTAIVIACVIIVKTHCTKSVCVDLTMITSARVRKLSLVMTISTRLCVWQRKRWETSLYTWAPLFDVIIAMVFQSISWAAMHSFPHRQHSKWIPKSLMVWSHWHRERCAIVRCGISRQIWSVVRKWAKDKWNERVLGQVNNQAVTIGPTQEWKHACTISEEPFARKRNKFMLM